MSSLDSSDNPSEPEPSPNIPEPDQELSDSGLPIPPEKLIKLPTRQLEEIQDHLDQVEASIKNLEEMVESKVREVKDQLSNLYGRVEEIATQTKNFNNILLTIQSSDQKIGYGTDKSRTTSTGPGLKHIICLATLPYQPSGNFDYEGVLLPALKKTLELEPHYWEIVRGDDQYYNDVIDLNIEKWMQHAQAYVVDVSDKDPEIHRILERLCERKQPEHPLIVLERQDCKSTWFPRSVATCVSYPNKTGSHAIEDIVEELREGLKRAIIDELNKKRQYRYLSPLFLKDICIVPEQHVKALTSAYKTIEEFCAATPKEICLKVPGLSEPSAEEYKSNAKKAVALP